MKTDRRSFLQISGMLFSSFGLMGSFEGIKVFLKPPKEERPPRLRGNRYREDGKNPVCLAGGRGTKQMVMETVSRIGGFERIGIRGKTVLVKPNVVSGRRNPTTTNPEVVKTKMKSSFYMP